jgi:hypothetical protein
LISPVVETVRLKLSSAASLCPCWKPSAIHLPVSWLTTLAEGSLPPPALAASSGISTWRGVAGSGASLFFVRRLAALAAKLWRQFYRLSSAAVGAGTWLVVLRRLGRRRW